MGDATNSLGWCGQSNPTHAGFSSAGTAQECRILGHNLSEESGSILQPGGQLREGGNVEPEVAINADPVVRGLFERQLEGAEEAGGAWDCYRYEAELTEDLLPALVGDVGGAG